MALLEVKELSSGYGDLPVVREVDVRVEDGEVVTIVGPNGAGKTSLLKTVTGLIPAWQGTVHFDGKDITSLPAHQRPELGLVMVPEGRKLFPFMTVEENLLLGAFGRTVRARTATSLAEVYELFPILTERRTQLAGSLSGGEQQQCALGRAMMTRPRLLILDEPSLGLAPILVERMLEFVKQLAGRGMTTLLVEQNVHDALEMADRAYVLEQGHVVMTGTGAELLTRPDLQEAYLGV